MIYKVGILGATGRMGLELAALLSPSFDQEGDSFELAAAVAKSERLTHIEGVEVRTLREPPREPVHVWIDFSRPEATIELLGQIDTPVVIGTTGFSEPQRDVVTEYARRRPVLQAANTSRGLAILGEFLERFPRSSEWPADVILQEEHHRHKVDSPSGTAKSLSEILVRRGHQNIQTLVVRAGEIVGTHRVRFVLEAEEIEITHRVSQRKAFAKGALVATAFVLRQTSGLYEMKDVFTGGQR